MDNETNEVSWAMRIAAALCLGTLCFAAYRIAASGAGFREVFGFFKHLHMAVLLPLMIYGAFISIRILVMGRCPKSRFAPGGVPIEERFAKYRKDLIGKLVVYGAILAFLATVLYMVFWMNG